jgi:hypothetical protein
MFSRYFLHLAREELSKLLDNLPGGGRRLPQPDISAHLVGCVAGPVAGAATGFACCMVGHRAAQGIVSLAGIWRNGAGIMAGSSRPTGLYLLLTIHG